MLMPMPADRYLGVYLGIGLSRAFRVSQLAESWFTLASAPRPAFASFWKVLGRGQPLHS